MLSKVIKTKNFSRIKSFLLQNPLKMRYLLFLAFLTYSFLEVKSQTGFTLGFADSLKSALLHEQRQFLFPV
jgi:hypothetical protein